MKIEDRFRGRFYKIASRIYKRDGSREMKASVVNEGKTKAFIKSIFQWWITIGPWQSV